MKSKPPPNFLRKQSALLARMLIDNNIIDEVVEKISYNAFTSFEGQKLFTTIVDEYKCHGSVRINNKYVVKHLNYHFTPDYLQNLLDYACSQDEVERNIYEVSTFEMKWLNILRRKKRTILVQVLTAIKIRKENETK